MSALDKLACKPVLRIAGLMSGTSADGVDVAIVDIPRRGGVRLVTAGTVRYPAKVRQAVLSACDAATGRVDDVCHLNFALGELFAEALGKIARGGDVELASIDLVGSHGQTIHHLPAGRHAGRGRVASTLQIGEPCVIAERTGIATVADFRPRDIAAGGQGAPLVPYADFVLLADRRRTRAVQNIGGIANVTYLPAGGGIHDVIAFDTGPGNMILDRLAELVSDGRLRCDRNGRLAAAGEVHTGLLRELMRQPYLRRRPPKSTGRERFGRASADGLRARAAELRLSDADLLATATAFTARSIADAYRRHLPAMPDEVILCGGGAENPTLVAMLAEAVAPAAVTRTDDCGIPADAKEAISFAVLAAATVRGQANNVPTATGAARLVVLGKIVLP